MIGGTTTTENANYLLRSSLCLHLSVYVFVCGVAKWERSGVRGRRGGGRVHERVARRAGDERARSAGAALGPLQRRTARARALPRTLPLNFNLQTV